MLHMKTGCELSDSNYITVSDETGEQHWQANLGYSTLTDAGIEVDETDEFLVFGSRG